jgi:Spy/CpxP family protein refolding chaperone
MKRNQPAAINVLILLLAVLGVNPAIYCRDYRRAQSPKNERPERLMHFLFLADSNLVDGRRLLEVKDKIGLTPEQEEKIENLVLEQEALNIRSSAEIKIKEMRFATSLGAGKMDRKEMETYIREISAAKTRLIVNYINYLLDVRDLLTPRQLEILRQIKVKRKSSIQRNPRESSGE